jgi:hypothetical protein
MDILPGMFAIIFAIVLGIVLVMVLRVQSQRKQRLSQLASQLGSSALDSGTSYQGELDSHAYRYQYFAGSRNAPSYFRITIDQPSDGEFQITRENGIQRFFKHIGISSELQTGDRSFDRKYYIKTDVPAFCRQCLADARRRSALNRLFELGHTRVTHDGETLEAKIIPFKFDNLQGKEYIEETVRELASVASGLDQIRVRPGLDEGTAWKARRYFVYALSIGATTVGLVGYFWGNAVYTPLDTLDMFSSSLAYSIPALIVFLAITVVWLRGRSSSYYHVLTNLALGVFGIPAAALGIMMILNGYLDTNPVTEHRARIIGKDYTSSKNSKTYYATLRSWRPGRREEKIEVSHGVYRRIETGNQYLTVFTRPGRFGFEWVFGYRGPETQS